MADKPARTEPLGVRKHRNTFDPSQYQIQKEPTPNFTPSPRRPPQQKISLKCRDCGKSCEIWDWEINRSDGYVCDRCSK